MEEKVLQHKKNGMLVLILTTFFYLAAVAAGIFGGMMFADGKSPVLLVVSIIWLCIGWLPYCGLRILKPQEALVLTLFGKYTGTFGDYGAFSFNGNKIITTSGGGMLVCNLEEEKAKERIAKVRFWATQAREPARHYEHKEIGYNYRMSNILAGIGRGQMKVLEQRVEQKRKIFAYYQEHLGDLEGISFMPVHEDERANCWLSVIQIAEDCPVKPLDVMEALEQGDVESRPVWKPMHLQPVFSGCDYIDHGGVAETLFNRGVCLPSDNKMTEADLERVCGMIRGLWE